MSCCGSKRKALIDQMKGTTNQSENYATSGAALKERTDKVFEFRGDDALTIYGSASGAMYQFRFKGDRITVSYFDSFALMAERDLKQIVG
jgi:hypothetical protein